MRGPEVALACCLALPLWAGGVGDDENPYERCALCHGYFGDTPRTKFPKLAAQNPAYLMAQLQAFLAGTRTNDGGQMAAIVTELGPKDLAIAVDWFAAQDPPTPAEQAADASALYAAGDCGSCHDPGAPGAQAVPWLTAQHPAYLAKQMRDFRDGDRMLEGAAKTAAMHALSDGEIDQLAAWLGAQPRQSVRPTE